MEAGNSNVALVVEDIPILLGQESAGQQTC